MVTQLFEDCRGHNFRPIVSMLSLLGHSAGADSGDKERAHQAAGVTHWAAFLARVLLHRWLCDGQLRQVSSL